MIKRKHLFTLSIGLLIFNILIGSLALFNDWRTVSEIAKASDLNNNSSSEVLGANSTVPVFDKNFVINNLTFSSTRDFPTEASVQNFLDKVNSPLKNYIVDAKPASFWIFSASRGSTSSKYGVVPNINPAIILTFLEKEQSLLSLKNYDIYKDPEKRIRSAMGYGCPDTSACESTYYGFVNQVNWGAFQLQFNYNNAVSGNFVLPYKVENTITTLDEYNVFLTNEATAAVYRYTPHVYWGAYNTWKIIVANGWGQNTSTFSYAQLDGLNLVEKDIAIAIPDQGNITLESVSNLLNTGCNLGQTGENIKQMQKFLRQEGYFMNREITGVCGTVTRRAIEVYFGRAGALPQPVLVSAKEITSARKNSTAPGLNSRTEPCGSLGNPGIIPWGTKGTITEGPTARGCLGGNWNWYKVQWGNGATGWSVSNHFDEGNVNTSTNSPATVANNPVEPAKQDSPPTAQSKRITSARKNSTAPGLNSRTEPCGSLGNPGIIPWGTKGTITEGPTARACLGGNWNWYKVQWGNGATGWSVSNHFDEGNVNTSTNSPATVATQISGKRVGANSRGATISSLNVRATACGTRISTVAWGTKGTITEGPAVKNCLGGDIQWLKVKFDNGITGWVSARYLD